MECLMPQANDFSRSLVPFEQNSTLVAVIELSQSSWLIAGTVPGIDRQPLKKITPDETVLLRLLHRWRDEAIGKGRTITRIAVAFEAGRDGFWLARWLAKQGIEMHVIHSSSVAVSREHKRAKTDRLDTAMLTRVFLGWLRGEHGHCGMVAVPTFARLAILREQIKAIEEARLKRLEDAPLTEPNAMVLMLASVIGLGIETAYMLVVEVFSRNLPDRRAVARYAGLTGAPDESGSKRREKGLAKAGNARVRRGMIQLAWRFLLFQQDSALARWFRARTEDANSARKTKMIVALARKLLIALWRMVTTGEVPHDVVLRQAG
jgi:transposase